MGIQLVRHLAISTLPKAEICQVKELTQNPVESIPPADAVRASLCAALHHVQLLRGLLKLAERKERQAKPSRREKEAPSHA
jgi:hypothetical protein